jgi:GNAT superfamily N-acetyltransferase
LWTGVPPDDPKPLSDGLMLRQVERGDRAALVELFGLVHAGPDGSPNAAVRIWVGDLFDRGHPTIRADLMLVVEDPSTGDIVSSFMMIPQTWNCAEVPLETGLLELAATHPRYRGRGLLKHLIRELCARGQAHGHVLQGMTDVLYFGDDAGFEMAVEQRAGCGGRFADLPAVVSRQDAIALAPAQADDIEALARIDAVARRRALLSCVRDAAQWDHELHGRSAGSMVHDDIFIIRSSDRPIGYLVVGYGGIPSFPIPSWLPGLPCPEPMVSVSRLELVSDAVWFDVTPAVLQRLSQWYAGTDGAPDGYLLWLGQQHPAYEVLADAVTRRSPPMGWFLRVPDMIALLRRLTPVFEQRLIGSAAQAFSGDVRLHFYRYGIRLRFVNGLLCEVESWPDYSRRGSDVSLPERMFLQLLFGNAAWPELARAFPDSRLQTRTGTVLVPILFPARRSCIWPVI